MFDAPLIPIDVASGVPKSPIILLEVDGNAKLQSRIIMFSLEATLIMLVFLIKKSKLSLSKADPKKVKPNFLVIIIFYGLPINFSQSVVLRLEIF